MDTDNSDLPPWFVTGFAERECSFTYSRGRRGVSLYFGLRFRARDDELLERFRRFFGRAGKVYATGVPRPRRSGSSRPRFLRITRIAELLRVVSHFDLHPFQGRKQACFEIWREMVLLKAAPTAADRDRLDLLAAQLSALVPPGRTRRRGTPRRVGVPR